MKRIVATLVFVAGLLADATASSPAPVFSLFDLQGNQVRLEDLKAKVIVLDFWAVWCKTCKEAFPALNDLQKKYGPQGLQVVGVNLDRQPSPKISGFAKKAQISYMILLDPKGETTKPYDIKGVPSLIILDENRNIAKRFRGYSPDEGKKIEAAIEALLK